jgi:hypothetical protein
MTQNLYKLIKRLLLAVFRVYKSLPRAQIRYNLHETRAKRPNFNYLF